MSFQWLQQRIEEEADRRRRETITLERLPVELAGLHGILKGCIASYQEIFPDERIEAALLPTGIRITVQEPYGPRSGPSRTVDVAIAQEIPGYRVVCGETKISIEAGILGNDTLYYRDQERDMFLNTEDLTRRILDRVLFPKLRE
jgi:hypothetical protein